VLALVDQGNSDPLSSTPEKSIPANVDVGISGGVISRGGIEGAFTCVCPPVDFGYALNRGLGPLDGELNRSCAFESRVNELSGSAYVMWLASVAVYGPSRGCGMGFEMLDLSSSIDVFPFPVCVPGLGVLDPALSNLPVVKLDGTNAAFSSSCPPPLLPRAYTLLGYPPPLLEVTSYQVLCLSCLLFGISGKQLGARVCPRMPSVMESVLEDVDDLDLEGGPEGGSSSGSLGRSRGGADMYWDGCS